MSETAAQEAGSAPSDLASFTQRVSERLHSLTRSLGPELEPVVAGLVERPGKRLRSRLVAHCAALGDADTERVVRAGALVELLQVASLLHDDIVDQAETRRFAPAAHVTHGVEPTILGGVACFALAGIEAADLGARPSRVTSHAVAQLSRGELLDAERAFDVALSADDYVAVVEAKTAALFRLSCELGALEAGCERHVRDALAEFGAELGIAFQVLDDCLDIEDAGTGKPGGRDLTLGLFGAPVLCALAAARDDRELASLLLSPELTETDLARVSALVVRHGGIATARELAAARLDRALAALDPVPDGPGRDGLESLACQLRDSAP